MDGFARVSGNARGQCATMGTYQTAAGSSSMAQEGRLSSEYDPNGEREFQAARDWLFGTRKADPTPPPARTPTPVTAPAKAVTATVRHEATRPVFLSAGEGRPVRPNVPVMARPQS